MFIVGQSEQKLNNRINRHRLHPTRIFVRAEDNPVFLLGVRFAKFGKPAQCHQTTLWHKFPGLGITHIILHCPGRQQDSRHDFRHIRFIGAPRWWREAEDIWWSVIRNHSKATQRLRNTPGIGVRKRDVTTTVLGILRRDYIPASR
jgi:hypothetical protein